MNSGNTPINLLKKALPVAVVLAAIIVAVVINNIEPEIRKHAHHKKPMLVETMVLKPQNWSATIKTQGVVEPRTMSVLTSRVSGEVVWVSNELRSGGFFEKGDTLLKIEKIDYELAIKTAEAALVEARFLYQEEQAQSKQAVLNWARLGRKQAPTDLVLRKPQLAKATAAVASAQASLLRAKLDLKRTVIKAPYAGRVLEVYVDLGQYISGNKELLKLFAIDRVEVRLPLSESQREQLDLPSFYRGDSIAQNKVDYPIRIKARIGGEVHEWKGMLNRVEGSVNLDTRQQYIVAIVDKPFQENDQHRPALEIGQYVEAELAGRVNDKVFLIPRSAVQGEGQIMLVDKDKRLQRKSIKALVEQGDFIVVRDGVTAGDRLCVSYIPFASNGTLVRLSSEVGLSSESVKDESAEYKNQARKQGQKSHKPAQVIP